MYSPHEVVLKIHGKGDAYVDANFTFALNMYDVTPRHGSLAGGTNVTISTSSLTSAKDLGVASYSLSWIPEEEVGISKYIAAYLGITFAVTDCQVRYSTQP